MLIAYCNKCGEQILSNAEEQEDGAILITSFCPNGCYDTLGETKNE